MRYKLLFGLISILMSFAVLLLCIPSFSWAQGGTPSSNEWLNDGTLIVNEYSDSIGVITGSDSSIFTGTRWYFESTAYLYQSLLDSLFNAAGRFGWDTFYVAETSATVVGWILSGDTIFIDTSSGGGGGGTGEGIKIDSSGFADIVDVDSTVFQKGYALIFEVGSQAGWDTVVILVDTSTLSGLYINEDNVGDLFGQSFDRNYFDTTGDSIIIVYSDSSDIAIFDTDDLTEGSSNLYDQALPDSGNWSDGYAIANALDTIVRLGFDRNYFDTTGDSVIVVYADSTDLAIFDTDDLIEGSSNLYDQALPDSSEWSSGYAIANALDTFVRLGFDRNYFDTTGDSVIIVYSDSSDISIFDTDDLTEGSSNLYDQALADSGNWSDGYAISNALDTFVRLGFDRSYFDTTGDSVIVIAVSEDAIVPSNLVDSNVAAIGDIVVISGASADSFAFKTVTELALVQTASNVGNGTADVFKQKSGVDLEFYTLAEGANITLTTEGDSIVIAGPASAGTQDSIGVDTDGDGVVDGYMYSSVAGAAHIKKGTNITLTLTGDTVTIAGPAASGTADSMQVDSSGSGDYATVYSTSGYAFTLREGSGIDYTVDNDTVYIAATLGTSIALSSEVDAFTEAELEAHLSDEDQLISEDEINSSSEIAAIVTDETGTGVLVFGTSPTLTTPDLVLKTGIAPTAEGDIEWNLTTNRILVGDGAATQTFYPGDWAVADSGGDITGITAGDGLTGGGITGDVVLNIGAGTGITVTANTVAHTAHTGQVTGAAALIIAVDSVNDTHINFGTGAGQVSATDLPDFGTMTVTDDYILVADGADFEAVAMTGDVFINDGTTIVQDDAIDPTDLIDSNVVAQGDIVVISGSSADQFGFKTVGELDLVETASNVGDGSASIFKQKSGTDLEFYTLVEGTNITFTLDGDSLIITAGSGVADTTLVLAEAGGGSDKVWWSGDTLHILSSSSTDTLHTYHSGTEWVIDCGDGLIIVDSMATLGYYSWITGTDTTQLSHDLIDSMIGQLGVYEEEISVEILESNVSKDDPLLLLNFMAEFDVNVANDTSYVTLDFEAVADGYTANPSSADQIWDWGVANYQPLEATLTDIADGTINENLVNTAYPWADNEIASSGNWNTAHGWGDWAATVALFDTSYIYLNVDSILQVDTILISGDYITDFAGDKLSVTSGILNVTETDPIWVSDSSDYAFKTWVQIEIEDSLNEYSLTSAITAGYVAKTDSGTWKEISDKLIVNQIILGNVSDSATPDSNASTRGYVEKIVEDSLNEYSLTTDIESKYFDTAEVVDTVQGMSFATDQITDGTILEADLNISNAPTGLDGYLLSLNEAGNDFTWITGGAGETNTLEDSGTFNGTEGFGWTQTKAGTELRIRGIIEGSNIAITASGDTAYTITAAGAGDVDTNAAMTIGGVVLASGVAEIQTTAVWAEGEIFIGDGTTYPTLTTMSGDATIASASGLLTIQDDAVDPSDLIDSNIQAQGDFVMIGASSEFAFKTVVEAGLWDTAAIIDTIQALVDSLFDTTDTDDNILVADGSGFASVAMSGDVEINNGIMTITANAVGNSEIANNSIGNAEMMDDAITPAEMADATHGSIVWLGGSALINTGAVTTTQLLDNTIQEIDLEEVGGSPVEEDILTYDAGTAGFQWHTPAELGLLTSTSILWTERSDTMFLVDVDGDTLAAIWDDDLGNVRWQVGTHDQTLHILVDTIGISGDKITDFAGSGLKVTNGVLQFDQPLTLTQPILAFKQGSGSTAEGVVEWNATTNRLGIGSGGGDPQTLVFYPGSHLTEVEVQAEIEDSLNEYSLTTTIASGYIAKTDSGTWDEVSDKLIINQAKIGNASDSSVGDSGVSTQGYVQKMIEDSLNEYSLSSAISSTYETITNVAKIGDDTANFKIAYDSSQHDYLRSNEQAVDADSTGTEVAAALADREDQLDNEAGLYGVLSDVANFVQDAEVPGLETDAMALAAIGDTINARMTKAVTGNTETRIVTTYNPSDSTYDFVVDDMNDDEPEAADYGNLTLNDPLYAPTTGTVACSTATAILRGVAKFNTDNFAVSSGDVTIKSSGVNSDEILNQTITKADTDTTASNFVFDDAYRGTSAVPDSAYTTQGELGDTAIAIRGDFPTGLAAQSVKGDHVDSVGENFVFDGAYHVTSATEDSAYMTANTIGDSLDLALRLADTAAYTTDIKTRIHDSLELALRKSGGTMSGGIDMGDKDITNAERVEADTFYIGAVDPDSLAMTKKYIDAIGGSVDEMEIFGSQIVHGDVVQEQLRYHLDTFNIKAVQADTCLDIIVPKTSWVRNEKMKITLNSSPSTMGYQMRDSILTGSDTTIVFQQKYVWGPNSKAEWVDSLVSLINNSAAANRVTAEDSGDYYVMFSDSNCQKMDIFIDTAQAVDTITSNDMYRTIHPSVIYEPLGVTDSLWTYLMGMTGYVAGASDYENPSLRVSHDNIIWSIPIVGTDTCPDPIFTNFDCTSYTHQSTCSDIYGWDSGGVASHLSDAHLRYWTDGNFYFYARATFYYTGTCGNEAEDAIFVSKSTDLVNWSDPLLVAGPDSTTDFISPSSELHKFDTLYFWAIHQGPVAHDSTNRLMLYKTEHPESTWTFIDTCIVYPYFGGITDSVDSVWARTHGLWHPEVRKWGPNEYYILNADQNQGLFIGLSDDGLNFNVRKDPLLPDYTDQSEHSHTLYKSSSIKIQRGSSIGLGVWYSHYYGSGNWQTSYTETFYNDTLFYHPITLNNVAFAQTSADSVQAYTNWGEDAVSPWLSWCDSSIGNGTHTDTIYNFGYAPAEGYIDSLYITLKTTQSVGAVDIYQMRLYWDPWSVAEDSVPNLSYETVLIAYRAQDTARDGSFFRARYYLLDDFIGVGINDSLFVRSGQQVSIAFYNQFIDDGSVRMGTVQMILREAWRNRPWWNNRVGYTE